MLLVLARRCTLPCVLALSVEWGGSATSGACAWRRHATTSRASREWGWVASGSPYEDFRWKGVSQRKLLLPRAHTPSYPTRRDQAALGRDNVRYQQPADSPHPPSPWRHCAVSFPVDAALRLRSASGARVLRYVAPSPGRSRVRQSEITLEIDETCSDYGIKGH